MIHSGCSGRAGEEISRGVRSQTLIDRDRGGQFAGAIAADIGVQPTGGITQYRLVDEQPVLGVLVSWAAEPQCVAVTIHPSPGSVLVYKLS